jgi:hypothetical protein
MQTIRQVRDRLQTVVKDEASLRMINSRLILRTGVSLLEPRPTQESDGASVAKVTTALREMGFDFSS